VAGIPVLRKISERAWIEARERLTKTGTDRKVCVQRPTLLRGGIVEWLAVGLLAVLQVMGNAALGQSTPAGEVEAAASPLSVDPVVWVKAAVVNELASLHYKGSFLRYRMHLVDDKGDKVRDVIESKDGSVARLILRDGKPLTEEQDNGEHQRLNEMLASPSAYAKHVKSDESGIKIADTLIRLMPEAMLYTYVPGQPQTGKNPGMVEIVLDYEPNPKFSPPTTTAEALTGLKGRVWIDAKTKHVVRMEGTIFRSINFGWGMLAHIYPGGKLMIEQADSGGGRWIFTNFTEQISVRALMVKTLNVKNHVEASEFKPIRAMSYQDAIHVLLDTPLPK
jgi:hypothetical protein